MSHNTWIHRLARIGVRPLVSSHVSPNQLTSLRLLAGLGAAGCFASGPHWTTPGALLFLIAMLLDRADGELARLSGRTSHAGHLYDLVSDALCNGAVFVGIGLGLRHGPLGTRAVWLGALAGAAVVYILWMVLRIEKLEGERAAELRSNAGFDADDAMIAAPVMAWLGWSRELLIAAAIGAPLFALYLFWRFHSRLRISRG